MRSAPASRPVRGVAAPLVAPAVAPAVALVLTGLVALTGCTAEEPLPSPTDSVTEVAPSGTSASPSPSPTDVTAGAATPTPTPTVSPSPSAVSSSAVSPSPSASPTGVAVGGLVDGFPTDVVPVPPDAEVTLSNVVDGGGGARTVALAGTTGTGADDLVAFYTAALTGQGFTATTPPGVDGAVVTTFTRGGAAELLTLSITSTDGQQDFSIGGRLA